MKNASRLYDALLSFVGQSGWSDLRHASVLVWMVIGVIARWQCQFDPLAVTRRDPRSPSAEYSKAKFLWWLHNPRIHPTFLYRPLIQTDRSHWQDPVLYLSFDTTMLWEQFCVIRLVVVYRGRAIPV